MPKGIHNNLHFISRHPQYSAYKLISRNDSALSNTTLGVEFKGNCRVISAQQLIQQKNNNISAAGSKRKNNRKNQVNRIDSLRASVSAANYLVRGVSESPYSSAVSKISCKKGSDASLVDLLTSRFHYFGGLIKGDIFIDMVSEVGNSKEGQDFLKKISNFLSNKQCSMVVESMILEGDARINTGGSYEISAENKEILVKAIIRVKNVKIKNALIEDFAMKLKVSPADVRQWEIDHLKENKNPNV